MNTRTILIGVGIVIVVIVVLLFLRNLSGTTFTLFSSSKVTIHGNTFSVDVAKTDATRQKGLSGKGSLSQDRGMIFVFDTPDYYPFWMRQMKFPLDIIYINNNKVVTIISNAQPPKNDSEQPKIYNSTAPADRVLEINGGLAQKDNIKVGDTVDISL